MHKLRRFFYQNKYQIFAVVGAIVFVIIIIQLLNNLVKEDISEEMINKSENIIINNESNQGMISEKSAVTGNEISKSKLDKATTAINSFIEFCNNQNLEEAYSLLTEECKKQIYSSLETFKQSYYKNVFNGEKKNCTIENWVNDTYKVNITGDILATGNYNEYAKQDYITVKEEDDEYKLNINNYIGYTEINKVTTHDNAIIEVVNKNTFKDYEQYTIKVTNNTSKIMQLDNISNTDSLYIEDSKGVKYLYYNHELTTPMLTVSAGQTKEITIKFYSSYVSTKKIEKITFSNIMLKDGELGETMKMDVNI